MAGTATILPNGAMLLHLKMHAHRDNSRCVIRCPSWIRAIPWFTPSRIQRYDLVSGAVEEIPAVPQDVGQSTSVHIANAR